MKEAMGAVHMSEWYMLRDWVKKELKGDQKTNLTIKQNGKNDKNMVNSSKISPVFLPKSMASINKSMVAVHMSE